MTPSSAPEPRAALDEDGFSAELRLPLRASAASKARRIVGAVLAGWGCDDEDFTYEAQLTASELVGNAVRHGGEDVALELRLTASSLVVAVRDGSAVLPVVHAVDDEEERGRGLSIVLALARDWGVDEFRRAGKRVWVELARPGRPENR